MLIANQDEIKKLDGTLTGLRLHRQAAANLDSHGVLVLCPIVLALAGWTINL